MSNPLAQFVVNQLIPEGRNEQGRAYQLTDSSVSPSRIIGYTEEGQEIEETICALAKSALFVDRDGNICTIPLRTGRVLSEEPEATRYEQIIVSDLIRQGQIPLECCPHTVQFAHLRPGPLVALPKGFTKCDGAPGAAKLEQACEHMQKIVRDRRAKAIARVKKEDDKLQAMKPSDVAALIEQMGKSFGDTVAASMSGKANTAEARANLREATNPKAE